MVLEDVEDKDEVVGGLEVEVVGGFIPGDFLMK